jgi:hypothetical protein
MEAGGLMARLTNLAFVELDLNMEMALQIGPTTEDDLSDEDMRVAWEHHRDRLMAQGSKLPGSRPWGWWAFEAGRDEHLLPYPSRSEEESAEERSKALDAYAFEPVLWLAEHGHLRDDEIAALAEDANVARTRVNTPAEHYGPSYFPDRRAIELYERVSAIRKRRGSVGDN